MLHRNPSHPPVAFAPGSSLSPLKGGEGLNLLPLRPLGGESVGVRWGDFEISPP